MKNSKAENFSRDHHLKFNDLNLLEIALTHSSYANEHRQHQHNERLEYLGDAVLQLVISDYLYRHCPGQAEGFLTKVRSLVVREETLADLARELKVNEALSLGYGEDHSGGADNPANLADAMEAVIGAIYLDQGFAVVQEQVIKWLHSYIDRAISGKLIYDYKSKIHELAQKHNAQLSFALVAMEGPAHSSRFTVDCLWNNQRYGRGVASSKKQAEQLAAAETLKLLAAKYNLT